MTQPIGQQLVGRRVNVFCSANPFNTFRITGTLEGLDAGSAILLSDVEYWVSNPQMPLAPSRLHRMDNMLLSWRVVTSVVPLPEGAAA